MRRKRCYVFGTRVSNTANQRDWVLDNMPASIGASDIAPADRRGPVHLPDPDAGAVVLLPQNVRLAVVVEITSMDNMAAALTGSDIAPADRRGPVHLPDPDAGAVVLLPQNV